MWDVSQNVDRAKSGQGLVSAITPNGIDFVSNRQTTLPGSELLVLQGIPTRRLHIGNESERELQDLAGNAMSMTVICKFYTLRKRLFLHYERLSILWKTYISNLSIEQKDQGGVATCSWPSTMLLRSASLILCLINRKCICPFLTRN